MRATHPYGFWFALFVIAFAIGCSDPSSENLSLPEETGETAPAAGETTMETVDSEGQIRQALSTIEVTNLNDSGPGSLRAAMQAAIHQDVITFADGLEGTIQLTSGPMTFNLDWVNAPPPAFTEVTVIGPGADRLTIDAGGNSMIFDMGGTSSFFKNFSMGGITIRGGHAPIGGAISAGGFLQVFDCYFTENTSTEDGFGNAGGGALYMGAGGRVENCTFSNNSAAVLEGGRLRITKRWQRYDRPEHVLQQHGQPGWRHCHRQQYAFVGAQQHDHK